MKLKPLHDRVIIKRLPEEEKTAGGIFIPDSAKERPMRGTVVAAGLAAGERIITDGSYDTALQIEAPRP